MTDTCERPVWRGDGGAALRRDTDAVVVEEPLEIRVGGRPVSVTMRTPGHDRELAVGWLLSEGVVTTAGEVTSLRQSAGGPAANVVDVGLGPTAAARLERLARLGVTASSCGICGKTAIETIHHHFPPLDDDFTLAPATILSFPDRLAQAQTAFARTGGLHAAAVFSEAGDPIVVREDVGRHNAVDKVLGHGLAAGLLPWRRHVLVVSGRASFEIVQKALAGGFAVVVAISAPSSLAVTCADESGQTLIGFARTARFNVYTHPQRVCADP